MSVWNNTALAGPAQHSAQTAIIDWSGPGPALVSVEFTAALTAPTTGPYYFDCRVAYGSVIMWLDDHLMCGTVELFRPETAPLPPFYTLQAGEPHFLRLQFFHNESSIGDASVSLLWSTTKDAAPTPVPASALTSPPQQFATQLNRTRMQRLLATGWGSWYRPSALAATLLPEGGTLTAGLCRLSTSMCMDPAAPFTPEQQRGPEVFFVYLACDEVFVVIVYNVIRIGCGESYLIYKNQEPKSVATSRPGLHTPNYWQLYLSFHGTTQEPSPSLLNVSLEWAGTGAGQGSEAEQDLTILATVVSGNSSDFVLTLSGFFAYNRAGNISLSQDGVFSQIKMSAYGLRSKHVQAVTPSYLRQINSSDPQQQQAIALALSSGVAAITTSEQTKSLAIVKAHMASSRVKAAFAIATTVKNHEVRVKARIGASGRVRVRVTCLPTRH